MTRPIRIQRKRTKGYDMQAVSRAANGLECVYVGRPSIWGNPFKKEAANLLTSKYRDMIERDMRKCVEVHHLLERLRGKNLSCFCPIDQPCHADVLLELANR